jgi:DNA (cytosine-5)-methyltransferase 3A
MNVLSLFDGMACGMLAMLEAGITVDRYVAYEIDKYAIQASSHNFPKIEHRGDVFLADFTEFRGFDFLIGGSPCTKWSIAQKNNRETEASGIGWELFEQYDRALHEVQPTYFIYENNKSMSKEIRDAITTTFGFEPICINSGTVSAQNIWRLYWVGKRNPNGTYSKVHVDQPEDRGLRVIDVLDVSSKINLSILNNLNELTLLCAHNPGIISDCNFIKKVLDVNCYELDPDSFAKHFGSESTRIGRIVAGDKNKGHDSQQYRVYSTEGKSVTLCGSPGSLGKMAGLYAVPVPFFCEGGYEVKDGYITVKGKKYPSKLADGFYIVRSPSLSERKRLQTVPEWYEFPVSDTQAYKMLGNGWTVAVITHLINATKQ